VLPQDVSSEDFHEARLVSVKAPVLAGL
jgi:hypothetical protein